MTNIFCTFSFLLESKLHLTSTPSVKKKIDTDVELRCSVIRSSSESSRYAVTWYFGQGAERKKIMSSDQEAKVTFGTEIEQSQRQRISMKRNLDQTFELSIRQLWTSDSGLYTCTVIEWLQDPRGDWNPLPEASTTTNLTVINLGKVMHLGKTL